MQAHMHNAVMGRKRTRDPDGTGDVANQKCRPERRANATNPVRKLTTQLLDTYKTINQLYYQKKKGGMRRCKLWRLLKIIQLYRDMLSAPAEDVDVADTMLRLFKAVNTWMWTHTTREQCFSVENVYQRFVASVGPEHNDLHRIQLAIDRFYLSVERIKIMESTFADHQGNYIAEIGEMLGGRYCVEGYSGGGAFCKAWKAFDVLKNEHVCIKIIGNRKPHSEQSRREVKILRYLAERLSPADAASPVQESGIVHLKHHFVFREHHCLVFPLLAYDLYELLKNENFGGVSLKLVRKFAVQICHTLSLLARPEIRLIHCDLKPENIMVVKHNQTRVNVIDFGSACFGEEQGSPYVQSRFYRSPEVLLGIPYTTQIDMWSFGCILFEMHTGRPLFTGKDAEDQLLKITSLLGLPNAEMMQARRFFLSGTKEGNQLVKQPQPFAFAERFRRVGYAMITRRNKVEDIKTDADGRVVDEALLQFIDLVTKCLDVEPGTRMTPAEALRHPFFSSSNVHVRKAHVT